MLTRSLLSSLGCHSSCLQFFGQLTAAVQLHGVCITQWASEMAARIGIQIGGKSKAALTVAAANELSPNEDLWDCVALGQLGKGISDVISFNCKAAAAQVQHECLGQFTTRHLCCRQRDAR